MTIAFACPTCGKAFAVAAAHAGRKARCKGCGGELTVPIAVAEEAYDLEDTPAGESAFVAALPNPELRPPRERGPSPAKLARRARKTTVALADRMAAIWPWLLGVPIGVAAVLGLVAAAVPGGTMIAGGALAVAGLLMVLAGYAVGAYGAFGEDSLHGFLYLFFPLYTAYFIASNLEEMGRWFALMTAGVVLATIGVAIMGAGLEKAGPADETARPPGRLGAVAPGRSSFADGRA